MLYVIHQLFYDTTVNVLKYPRERVLYVLSDNTASVSGEVGGCVALLQRKLKGEDTTEKTTSAGARAGRGGVPGIVLSGYRYLFCTHEFWYCLAMISRHVICRFPGSNVSTTCVAIGVVAAAASLWPTLGSSSYSSSRYYQ